MRCPTLTELPSPPPGKTGWPWTEESPQLPDTAPDPSTGLRTSGSPWPRVSIVTPSYNQEQFIEETIRSVLLQGYPDLEYIIIDGGSTDGSAEVIRKYEPWLAYWVSERDRGQSHAINKGIARASSDVLFWLNSDDLVLPGAFSTVAMLFAQNPQVRMITGQAQIIDAQGKQMGTLTSQFPSWADYATRKCTIRQVATFFDRALFDELGIIDESLYYSMDVDLLLRFTREHPPLITESFLCAYRDHGMTKWNDDCVAGYKEADQVWLRHLSGTGLEPDYLRWSAHNWLGQSTNRRLTRRKRLACLLLALRRDPKATTLSLVLKTVRRFV